VRQAGILHRDLKPENLIYADSGPQSDIKVTDFGLGLKLGADAAINYREQDFVAEVKALTAKKGVDVILDMVGGDYVQRNMTAAAIWGRIVNIAYQDGARTALDLNPMLRKRLTLAATTLRARSVSEKTAIRDALAEKVWPLVAAGRIRPVVDRRFPLAQAQAAHRYMNSGNHSGKILLTPDL